MHRSFRLTGTTDFRRARDQGRAFRNHRLVVLVRPNGLPQLRFGFIASRRLGGAVQRNRLRRLMREAARELIPGLVSGHDVVVIATRQTVGAPFAQIRESMQRLTSLAGLRCRQVQQDELARLDQPIPADC